MSKDPFTEKKLSEMADKPVYCPELECYEFGGRYETN
jgi:hypothetical protein